MAHGMGAECTSHCDAHPMHRKRTRKLKVKTLMYIKQQLTWQIQCGFLMDEFEEVKEIDKCKHVI